jgi:hypothetical protein
MRVTWIEVRERQVLRCGRNADGAAFDPAVPAVVLGVADRGVIPGQGIKRSKQFRLVFLDAEAEIGASR